MAIEDRSNESRAAALFAWTQRRLAPYCAPRSLLDFVFTISMILLCLAPPDADASPIPDSQTSLLRIVFSQAGCPDLDADGFPDEACGGSDCDDFDPDTHPGAWEWCDDGRDTDCDGFEIQCECRDADNDQSYAPIDAVGAPCRSGHDCDDADPTIHPGAVDGCDGIDNNCSGTADDGAGALDQDSDGFLGFDACGALGPDCDDREPGTHPDAQESCGNLIDDDCDGTADEGCGGSGGFGGESGQAGSNGSGGSASELPGTEDGGGCGCAASSTESPVGIAALLVLVRMLRPSLRRDSRCHAQRVRS